jgi:hypothetical protein
MDLAFGWSWRCAADSPMRYERRQPSVSQVNGSDDAIRL